MRKHTTEEFVAKAKAVHGSKYSYANSEYTNDRTKVLILCKEHGGFLQSPNSHLRGTGCPKCSGTRRLDTAIFIEKAKSVHGETYDYTDVEYLNNRTKVKIACRDHGVFFQTPNDHLGGHGCNKCAHEVIGGIHAYTPSDFITAAKNRHGDTYKYSSTEYINAKTKVSVECLSHGVFTQMPGHHLSGHGCPKCANRKIKEAKTYTEQEYIHKAKLIHGGEYQYVGIGYTGSKVKIGISCKKHGLFYQQPFVHLLGHGCPECANVGPSKGEKELANFVGTLVEVEMSDRKLIHPLEIDCIAPSKYLGVEFCGVYFHSDKFREDDYHTRKLTAANNVGYDLIQVFDDEWTDKKDIVKSVIQNRLGRTGTKLFARALDIKNVPTKDSSAFLEANHLQGNATAEVKLGLYNKGELIMIATFSSKRGVLQELDAGWFELVRLCTKIDTTVVGGFSRLLKYFRENYTPKGIKTFCDRRYFNGKGYEAVGFVKTHDSKPNYYYIQGSKKIRHSRYAFQKHKLAAKLEKFDPALTERENMRNNGYLRVYDCGNAVFKLSFDN